jgi:predicted transcriptional regulator
MPQSERSQIIKEFLKWLEAKTKQGGATLQQCVKHIQVEITEMGAEEKRCAKYLKDCERAGLISADRLKFKITEEGKNWLQRKVS